MKKFISVILSIIIVFSMIVSHEVYAISVDDPSVILKQGNDGRCVAISCLNMFRRRAIIDGLSDWNDITYEKYKYIVTSDGESVLWTINNVKGMRGGHQTLSSDDKKGYLISMLKNHPEGIVIYNGAHAVLLTDYINGIFYCIEPWYDSPYTKIPLTSATETLTSGKNQNVIVNNLTAVWYITNRSSSYVPIHTHSWKTASQSSHPHLEYKYCSCGEEKYTGARGAVKSCADCYPLGSVSLTRSFNRTTGSATFYRNNVSNAGSYTLNIYRKANSGSSYSLYTSLSMPQSSYSLTLPQGYYYYASVEAVNSNTGKSRTATCDSFRIYNTYTVTYNANGGTGAPSAQVKIQDEALTMSSTVPTRSHYVFKGWAASKNAVTAQYNPGDTYTKNANITLYAVWEPEIYDIKFDANGGKGELEDTTIVYGNSLKMPNTVINEGYYLRGWSVDKKSAVPEYKLGVDYKLDSDMTLYAVWGSSTWNGNVAASFAGGDGSEENPYQISNAAELAYLADTVNNQTSEPEYKYYILTDNINLGYEEWVPIGVGEFEYQYFKGSFDGNGYTISDMSITNVNAGHIGLFGYVRNSELKDLTIAGDIYSISSDSVIYAGAFAGYADMTTFDGCSAVYVNMSDLSAGASDMSAVGCIAGYAKGGEITGCNSDNCYIFLKSGNFDAGIIAGYAGCIIKDCKVNSENDELFGTSDDVGRINVGGICGSTHFLVEKCSVNAAYFSNTLKPTGNSVKPTGCSNIGGIAGYSNGVLKQCSVNFDSGLLKTIDSGSYYSSIMVTNASGSPRCYVGGIVGCFDSNSQLIDSKYDGQSISASSYGYVYVGGLIGEAYRKQVLTVKDGHPIVRGNLPTKYGYKATWYTDEEFTNKYDFSRVVSEDLTLYAKWEHGVDDTIEIWDGTSSEPAYDDNTKTYSITNGEELSWISDVSNGVITSGKNMPSNASFEGYIIALKNDIYLNETENVEKWGASISPYVPDNAWNPISNNSQAPFLGTFDGCNYSVFGVYIYDTGENANLNGSALFGYSCGIVRNLFVRDSYLYSLTKSAAGIVLDNDGIVERCFNYGNIYGYGNYCGGISALNSGIVTTCKNYGKISGTNSGGIVGSNAGADYKKIEFCSNYGEIVGYESAGGIVARNRGYVEYDYNIGLILSGYRAGGIAGCNFGMVQYSYNSGNISNYVRDDDTMRYYDEGNGGIVGFNSNCIENCYNTGNVTGYYRAGGIVGLVNYVTGSSGDMGIRFCYSTANEISCRDLENGIKGSILGGMVPLDSHSVEIAYCYANSSPLYGHLSLDTTDYSVISCSYLSTDSLKKLSAFVGFSEEIWRIDTAINNGYPHLSALKDSYVTNTHKVLYANFDDAKHINRCFANVDGIIYGESTYYSNSEAYAGGIIGDENTHGILEEEAAAGVNYISGSVDNCLVIADRVSSKANKWSCASDVTKTGLFNVSSVYSYSSLDLSAKGTYNIASSRTLSQLKRESFLKTVFGPNVYESVAHLDEDSTAVWVVKDGELPELYYNVLNDITVSEDITGGSIILDKSQAVDGEIVTVSSVPDENYVLNKLYVNGNEIDGNSFEVSGDSVVYATFSSEVEKYSVELTQNENATASIVNADAAASLMSLENDSLTADDGDEIAINVSADSGYNIDAIYVNGEEIAGDSFIVTSDSEITLDVSGTDTSFEAVTDDAEDVGAFYAYITGSVSENGDGTVRYIQYWEQDNPDEIYVTAVEDGGGDYEYVLYPLKSDTAYCYQMNDSGEVKTFVTLAGEDEEAVRMPLTSTTYKALTSTYKFYIESSSALESEALIAAGYDESGKMLEAVIVECDGDTSYTASMALHEGLSYVKIFVWSDVKSARPLYPAETVYIE